MLDQRAKILLKTLVERYISDGQPLGSRSLSKFSGLDLSPATIRNIMAVPPDQFRVATAGGIDSLRWRSAEPQAQQCGIPLYRIHDLVRKARTAHHCDP